MKIELVKGKILVESELISEELVYDLLKTKFIKNLNEKIKEEDVKPKLQTSKISDAFSTVEAMNTERDCNIKLSNGDSTENVIQEKVKDETTKKNIMAIVKEASETKLNEMKNPNRFNTGSVAITMSTLGKPDVDQIADIDKDICGYDRIRVFDSMERKCDITVINDGSDSLYFIVNRNGIDHEEEMWSQAEIMLYPGEAWKIFDVYELRIRSETQGNKYRVTEDRPLIGSTFRSIS